MTGSELRTRRMERGWSQPILARKLGVTRNYVSMLESGRRMVTETLARRLDIVFEEDSVQRGQFLRLGGVTAAAAAFSGSHPEEVRARRIFAAITAGNAHPFTSTQTSHTTDLIIRRHVAAHRPAVKVLTRWMAQGSPVLRVNAAGVLAKLGQTPLVDSVIGTLQASPAVRHLYLTAVVHRVCGLPWGQSEFLARDHVQIPARYRGAVAHELGNPRDGAARWCAVHLLGSDAPRELLLERLQAEDSAETLRALGQALA